MKNQISLKIKTPCQENFKTFASTPNGGFCNSCEKEVIDFTKMNTQGITEYFSLNYKENTCGRFKANQLNTFKAEPLPPRKYGILSGVGLACLALFSMSSMHAQDTKQALGSDTKTNISKFQNNILVKGTVSDSELPLPGVNVMLEGTETGTVTDFDGNFEFPKRLKKGDVLVFTSIGMDSQKIVVENNGTTSKIDLKVSMTTDTVILMGKIAVKEVYKSNRNR